MADTDNKNYLIDQEYDHYLDHIDEQHVIDNYHTQRYQSYDAYSGNKLLPLLFDNTHESIIQSLSALQLLLITLCVFAACCSVIVIVPCIAYYVRSKLPQQSYEEIVNDNHEVCQYLLCNIVISLYRILYAGYLTIIPRILLYKDCANGNI